MDELLGYFVTFWAFCLSSQVRCRAMSAFGASNLLGRTFAVFDALLSLLAGLGLPLTLLYVAQSGLA
ncbi:hypothetical protein SAMN02745857_02180 [Andreprevotia lacus DSM 23236]|jgi:hypothetical protein|uniref:Uncharacterized protein n=1 Tax=Andreprevotia lacus DSM 23236 TaxID=1121001 RepID=A0A1W1XNB9_9NEIS|nr:hypothetical protein [Andreprevotia lacus]SMC25463.1 hypothetical protein SAMN02745857_02180 [Andreprevotia lacus DSM 23236]